MSFMAPGQQTCRSRSVKRASSTTNYLDGRGTLEEVTVTIGEGETARTFPIIIAIPNQASSAPVPLVISQTFSDNCSVFPRRPGDTSLAATLCDGT